MGSAGPADRATLWKVHGGLVAVQVGYGSSYVLSKVALATGVDPIVFAVYRDAVCLAVLLPVALYAERGKRSPLTGSLLALLVAVGFFGAFTTQLLTLYGVTLTSASYTATISILAPLFTFIISTTFGFEQLRWRRPDGQAKLVGLLSAVFGAIVLAVYLGPTILGYAHSDSDAVPMSDLNPNRVLARAIMFFKISRWNLGVVCLFIAGFTLSITISLQVPILARYPAPISVSAFAYFFGASMLLVTALLTVKDRSGLIISEPSAIISFIYNGLVPAAFNFTVLIWAIQKAGPVLAASFVPLQLFTAAAFGYLFLDESLHLGSVLGAILIICGLGFITWGQAKSHNPDSAATFPVKPAPTLEGIPVTIVDQRLEEPLLR